MRWLLISCLFLYPTVAEANVLCCDGTESPTCTYVHAGCCSWHGGVCRSPVVPVVTKGSGGDLPANAGDLLFGPVNRLLERQIAAKEQAAAQQRAQEFEMQMQRERQMQMQREHGMDSVCHRALQEP